MGAAVESISVRRLAMPLRVPYRLALGTVRQLDVILVEMRAGDRSGWGEATILTGYTDETIEASWRLTVELADRLAGLGTAEAARRLGDHFRAAPFVVSAFTAALEVLDRHPALDVSQARSVPILAVLDAADPDAVETEVERRLGEGYRTLKVKVGFDRRADLERVDVIRRAVRGRAALRLDGNQGYGRDAACAFAAALDPDGIELLEQPCAAGDWDAALAVAKVSNVPMMLDESIYGLDDIARAAELGAARYVKLKLMKMGGIERLERGLSLIRSLGMEPVLGNGVATELNCWMEACVARRMIRNAGEMNGFLKPLSRLFARPLAVDKGAIRLEPGGLPELDRGAIEAVTVDRATAAGRPAPVT
jgi:o-succinylbenzoate synthase